MRAGAGRASGVQAEAVPSQHPCVGVTLTCYLRPRICGSAGDSPRSWEEEGALPKGSIPAVPPFPPRHLPQPLGSHCLRPHPLEVAAVRNLGLGYFLGTLGGGWVFPAGAAAALVHSGLLLTSSLDRDVPRAGFRLDQRSLGAAVPVGPLLRVSGSSVPCPSPSLMDWKGCSPVQSLQPCFPCQRVPPASC